MAIPTRMHLTLPSAQYFDPQIYRRELEAIWYQDWFCAGRESDWPVAGDYRVVALGDQRIVVLRDLDGVLQAFHNTCRHRGSVLCEKVQGRFGSGRIVCPYHAWSYALDGSLQATPRRLATADFRPDDYGLYRVALDSWGGFVFISLATQPIAGAEQAGGADARALASWPLATMQLAHRETHALACNWKVFWENFLECYHCPLLHPELCRLVPVYGKGLLGLDEDPAWRAGPGENPLARLAPGKHTWSEDGQMRLAPIEGVDPAMIAEGMRFAELRPSMFLVAHRDHVRCVRLRPTGPETTELCVEWLVESGVALEGLDLDHLCGLGRTVVLQDARACELVQQGMHCRVHGHGVLVPQEYEVLAFQRWVQQRLGQTAALPDAIAKAES